jgi:hypothetical protein
MFSCALLSIASCVVQNNGTLPATKTPPMADSPSMTITGAVDSWSPFPGASLRIEVPGPNDTVALTSAIAKFDAQGGFTIALPSRAELSKLLNADSLQPDCAQGVVTPASARAATAILAVYNAADKRLGILLNADSPLGPQLPAPHQRHALVFADVETKISGSCLAPANENYNVALQPGWNVMKFVGNAGAATEISRTDGPITGKWYYLSIPNPAL